MMDRFSTGFFHTGRKIVHILEKGGQFAINMALEKDDL